MDHSIFKLVPWDVWAAIALATLVIVLAVFDPSPLVLFLLLVLAVCAYMAIQDSNNSTRSSK